MGENNIGSLNEKSLHAALKAAYCPTDGQTEQRLDGYVIDIVSGEQLIEIQTGNFASMKKKLPALLDNHPVLLVHPIPLIKWIIRLDKDGKTEISRRRSPKRGRPEILFEELMRFPHLVNHPNLQLEIAFVEVAEIRRDDGNGSWRRKGWSIADQRLIAIMEKLRLSTTDDFANLIPDDLERPFTVKQLAKAASIPNHLATKMVYCLFRMDALKRIGKEGRAWLYKT